MSYIHRPILKVSSLKLHTVKLHSLNHASNFVSMIKKPRSIFIEQSLSLNGGLTNKKKSKRKKNTVIYHQESTLGLELIELIPFD